MTLKLQMLGTGSAFAKTHYNNNALLDSGEAKLFIDFGTTAPLALHHMGLPITDLDAIIITHIHADHVGGLEELGFRMSLIHGRKPVLYVAEALVEPLWEQTLKGGMYQKGMIERMGDIFEVRPLVPDQATDLVPGIRVELIPTKHIPGKDSYSLFINERLFYSADMTFNPELLTKLVQERGCRAILHEVQLLGEGAVHTTLDELLSLPPELQQMIHLMHYGDEIESFRGCTGEMRILEQQRIYDVEQELEA
ncbi:MBL fold metallo-hydrolase [Paenibacillus sp. P96]|uniref:MBL fold metallo-hydrolase n=1 Tax=Paenibacillus zeirhizosphaerae TaxID=2987519 RepID=A0ABT9FQ74_9BACL|nr:MBL fold metallo-hydrolase [Paenibacillus sp. P96]MDP4096872.1 MBL fold metallo-hydrolase [Paenibacillus sp. P96]